MEARASDGPAKAAAHTVASAQRIWRGKIGNGRSQQAGQATPGSSRATHGRRGLMAVVGGNRGCPLASCWARQPCDGRGKIWGEQGFAVGDCSILSLLSLSLCAPPWSEIPVVREDGGYGILGHCGC